MKYFITFVSTLFLIAASVFCAGITPLSFYTEPALFPFNAVVGIAEDSHDCLYFATHAGLIKYNGISSEKYEHIPFDTSTMRSSQIQTIYISYLYFYLFVEVKIYTLINIYKQMGNCF